jgi:hypothetical protein
MSINQNSAPVTVPETPALANLAAARKEMATAKKRHPAGTKVQAGKVPAQGETAEEKKRQAPKRSDAVKLR